MAGRALALREGYAPVRDRLLTMLFLAGLLHGLFILGLTFNVSADEGPGATGLEVLLVSDELPQAQNNPDAAYLAQRTQVGSGNTREAVAPRNRASSVPIPAHAGVPDGTALRPQSEAAGSAGEQLLTTTGTSTHLRYLADSGDAGTTRQKPLLLEQQATPQPGPEDENGPAQLRGPKRDELWVTPDSRAAIVAPYLAAWRHKVERIGTLNYPSAAQQAAGQRSPIVEVAIGADGRLEKAVIRQSSGVAQLDAAALEILKLASPFDRFPPNLARQYRLLRFAYEWQFVGGRVAY